ncbi:MULTISPECIES: DUF1090 domain-containing protein [Aeromonas]|uniref:DUF1090 domain-containing protein n=1 Tax=Aeromonas TaxID=642 RepID=UPI002DB74DB0|nr:DUF1090 domain-containing protein [Aeromonas sanarellii]MEB6605590.1 DUF1090 domain-containing protein [Aeromonas sanarellii]
MWKIAGIGLLLLAGQAYGSENVGCKARHQAVTEQLAFARAHDNAERVAGLEQALRNIETHCTDAGLLEDQQQKVVKQKAEVEERLADLQSARVAGKPDKIAKKQAKLEASQAELLEAQRELEALQKLLKP